MIYPIINSNILIILSQFSMNSERSLLQDEPLDGKTVLVLFIAVVIIVIYLISLLLIVVRRAKKLIDLYNRRYYLFILFYIATKLIICIILGIEIIVGIGNNWSNLNASHVQLLIKTGLVLSDFSIVMLFVISLQHYFNLCLSTLKDRFQKVMKKS